MARKQQPKADARQKQLEQDIAAFLASGGKIQQIEIGCSGETPWIPENQHNPCTRVVLANRIAPGFTLQ